MKTMRWCFFFLATLAVTVSGQSLEERVKALEAQVKVLQEELAKVKAGTSAGNIEELQRRLELLAEELQELQHGPVLAPKPAPRALGLAPAAGKVYRVAPGVSLGGYGELLYQNFASRREDGGAAGKVDTADALRYVLYTGYKFNDTFVFNSELELEHAHTEKGGELELEFAYVDGLFLPSVNLRAGMVLVPLGLVNEIHEPTTFLPAQRSTTESLIIPTTWRELGVGLYGDLGPLSYRSYLLTGLDARKFSAQGLRSGRQAGAKAKAETMAWVGRVDWTATPGFLAGIGAYLGNSGQDLVTSRGESLDVWTKLIETHALWQKGSFSIRALWAQARLDNVVALNQALGLVGSASVGRLMEGKYLEVQYDLLPSEKALFAPFLRWESVNTQKRVPRGYSASPANDQEILTLGLAYQPLPNLIFKLDWGNHQNNARTGVNRWNLAMGYVF